MSDEDPFLEAYNDILNEENTKESKQYILSEQKFNNISENKDNQIDFKEKEEEKLTNNINTKENKAKDEINNLNNDQNIEHSPNSFIGKKLKPDTELDPLQISSVDNNTKNLNINNKNEPMKEFTSISIMNNENKNIEEYDFGYSIILLNDGETGLIEDFLIEKQNDSTTEDYYNFGMDEEKWIKILNHSIFAHYQRHIKEESEKRKKIQAMALNNNSSTNQQMMAPMNQMMFMNMPNGLNFQQMYLQNLKSMPNQYNLNK